MLQQWPACNMADRAPPIVGGLGTCSSRAKRGRSVAEDAGDPLHQAKRFHKTQEVCRCAHSHAQVLPLGNLASDERLTPRGTPCSQVMADGMQRLHIVHASPTVPVVAQARPFLEEKPSQLLTDSALALR